jgi:hypothetical protein
MISVAGMEGGSGDGTAASRKAGWLNAAPPPRASVAGPRVPSARSAAGDLVQALANVALDRLANQFPPTTTVPQPSLPARAPVPRVDANGRPLPPDGSAPPARRPGSGPIADPPLSPARPPEFAPDGRPLPPNGAAPPPEPVLRAPASAPPSRPGSGPIAPPGHSFVARPVSAPPGEFRFAVRCSCGREGDAAVTLDMLREAAARGLSPAAAITLAQQAALDVMHRT